MSAIVQVIVVISNQSTSLLLLLLLFLDFQAWSLPLDTDRVFVYELTAQHRR